MKPGVKLAIGTPMYGGVSEHTYTESLVRLLAAAKNRQIPVRIHVLSHESLIQRGRNTIVHEFLKSDSTHLLFVDADIGYDPGDVFRMLEADKGIIGGIYPKKKINLEKLIKAHEAGVSPEHLLHCAGDFVYRPIVNEPINYSGVSKLKYLGTGFMMISRETFERLKPKVEFYYVNEKPKTEENKVWNFFACPIENGELLSEDYYFCQLAIDSGIDIYTIGGMQLTHTGKYTYAPCFMCSNGAFIHKLGQPEGEKKK